MLDFNPLRLPRVIKLSSTWSVVTRKPSLARSRNIPASNLIHPNRKRINNLLVFLGRASHGDPIERISWHISPRMTSNRAPPANKNCRDGTAYYWLIHGQFDPGRFQWKLFNFLANIQYIRVIEICVSNDPLCVSVIALLFFQKRENHLFQGRKRKRLNRQVDPAN